jgi:hypothetical protein
MVEFSHKYGIYLVTAQGLTLWKDGQNKAFRRMPSLSFWLAQFEKTLNLAHTAVARIKLSRPA